MTKTLPETAVAAQLKMSNHSNFAPTHTQLIEELHTLQDPYETLPLDAMTQNATNVNAMHAQTKRILWHQRLFWPPIQQTFVHCA